LNIIAYGLGIPIICRKKYGLFRKLFVEGVLREDGQRDSRLIEALGTANCLFHDAAQWLDPRPDGAQRRTPGSDWFVLRLAPLLRDVVGSDLDFENAFDEFDIILSLVRTDLGYRPNFGRYVWRGFHFNSHEYITRLNEELQSMSGNHPLLRAGLFNGDPTRLSECIKGLTEQAKKWAF
jgi:hypothetical protein